MFYISFDEIEHFSIELRSQPQMKEVGPRHTAMSCW